ncbi:MAG: response regulator [Chloroflexota bacterium]
MAQHTILLIEDSDEDYEVLQWIFEEEKLPQRLVRFDSGDEALKQLLSSSVIPDMILLDLNLPATDGFEVLVAIKAHKTLRRIPVIILTTSSSEHDINKCYDAGANSYLVKMVDLDQYMQSMVSLMHYWFELNQLPIRQPSD